jgi:hypothetical protein
MRPTASTVVVVGLAAIAACTGTSGTHDPQASHAPVHATAPSSTTFVASTTTIPRAEFCTADAQPLQPGCPSTPGASVTWSEEEACVDGRWVVYLPSPAMREGGPAPSTTIAGRCDGTSF